MKLALRHEQVGPENSPHRLRIAHLSDLHLWFSTRALEEIERRMEPWQPDVLALTGDYADTPRGQHLATNWILRMARRYPVCWVGGNHDTWWGKAFLERLSARPELNPIDRCDAWITTKSGHRFRFTSRHRLANGSSQDDASTVVLLHDPTCLTPETFHARGNSVVLAGHLHGGQIVLWRDRRGWPQPVACFYRWQVERARIGPATLIVSQGLGETLPVRFRAPREIVMVDVSA